MGISQDVQQFLRDVDNFSNSKKGSSEVFKINVEATRKLWLQSWGAVARIPTFVLINTHVQLAKLYLDFPLVKGLHPPACDVLSVLLHILKEFIRGGQGTRGKGGKQPAIPPPFDLILNVFDKRLLPSVGQTSGASSAMAIVKDLKKEYKTAVIQTVTDTTEMGKLLVKLQVTDQYEARLAMLSDRPEASPDALVPFAQQAMTKAWEGWWKASTVGEPFLNQLLLLFSSSNANNILILISLRLAAIGRVSSGFAGSGWCV
jgi:hypothetical protein